MSVRDPQVKDGNVGDSINIVEELLRRQQDFEKTVDAQEEKFTAITRATQVSHPCSSLDIMIILSPLNP